MLPAAVLKAVNARLTAMQNRGKPDTRTAVDCHKRGVSPRSPDYGVIPESDLLRSQCLLQLYHQTQSIPRSPDDGVIPESDLLRSQRLLQLYHQTQSISPLT